MPLAAANLMRLRTRLLLPLLAAVAIVMTVFATWAVGQRETTLTEQSSREVNAYAIALGLAIEPAFRGPTPGDVQAIIDAISRERTIYGVLVYGDDGHMMFASDPLGSSAAAPVAAVARVLAANAPSTIERTIDDEPVHSVLRPIHDARQRVVGAFEVAQPRSFLTDQIRQTRQRFILNTLTLLAAVTILILWLVQQLVSQPLGHFGMAAQALGRGELAHRISEQGGQELEGLAREFNRMAGHLETARTDLVRQAEQRVSLERRLRETEKLAALGNMAAGLAHEIAAPLHVIRGRTELLLRKIPENALEERNLRIIVEQIGRITVIMRNLLDFARRREPRLIATDLGAVLAGVLEFLDWEMGRARVTVTWEGPRELPVRADADLMHQVFINLFINAVQALEPLQGEGRIGVRTRLETGDTAGDGLEQVVVEVEDNGPGIPLEIREHSFEPFITTKTQGGTGLGLAVARSIVEEHGGRLELDSSPARSAGDDARPGALFRLLLPVSGQEAALHG